MPVLADGNHFSLWSACVLDHWEGGLRARLPEKRVQAFTGRESALFRRSERGRLLPNSCSSYAMDRTFERSAGSSMTSARGVMIARRNSPPCSFTNRDISVER